jgi:hypothetical protein
MEKINLSKPGCLEISKARYFYLLRILKCPKCRKSSELQIERSLASNPGETIQECYCLYCKNRFITIEEKSFPYLFTALLPRGKDLIEEEKNHVKNIFEDFKNSFRR